MIFLRTFTVDNLELNCVQMEPGDLHKVIICINEVTKVTPLNLFIPPNETYITKILNGYGRTLGLLYCNKLIAIASVVFPKTSKHNLGRYLVFDDILLNQVVQFEHGLVLSDYRGHGLLKILLIEHLKYIETKYSFFLSTVSPYNIPSLKTGFNIGQVIKSHIYYHGFERYVLFKKFTSSYSFVNAIKCNSIEKLDSYLSNGYVAVYNFDNACYSVVLEENYNETI